ncbi:hypothetical protein C8R45DRAFT_1078326, partial [Mycena sanguinolenta]
MGARRPRPREDDLEVRMRGQDEECDDDGEISATRTSTLRELEPWENEKKRKKEKKRRGIKRAQTGEDPNTVGSSQQRSASGAYVDVKAQGARAFAKKGKGEIFKFGRIGLKTSENGNTPTPTAMIEAIERAERRMRTMRTAYEFHEEIADVDDGGADREDGVGRATQRQEMFMKRILKLLGKSKPRASSAPPASRVPDPSAPSLTTLTRPASPQTAPAPVLRESLSLANQTAWANLKEVLKALHDGSDLHPPLKEALSGVSSAMDSIERIGEGDDEFVGIIGNIKGFQGILSQYGSEKDISPAMHTILDAMTSELVLIEGAIRSKMQPRHLRHILEAPSEVNEVLTAFKRFSSLIDKLQLNMGLYVSNYSLNIFGGVGGAGGMSEQGTAGSGGIGQGPNLHFHAINSTVNTHSTNALEKLGS